MCSCPYYNYEVKTKFLEEGITYDDLSDEDKKERYEEDFVEDGLMPDFIPSAQLNKFVFNETTVDTVLQDLMERGIRVTGGDRLGKTIIFAQNKRRGSSFWSGLISCTPNTVAHLHSALSATIHTRRRSLTISKFQRRTRS